MGNYKISQEILTSVPDAGAGTVGGGADSDRSEVHSEGITVGLFTNI